MKKLITVFGISLIAVIFTFGITSAINDANPISDDSKIENISKALDHKCDGKNCSHKKCLSGKKCCKGKNAKCCAGAKKGCAGKNPVKCKYAQKASSDKKKAKEIKAEKVLN